MFTDQKLTLEQRQVVAFVAEYLREYDHLPVGTEVARGCGFRSPRSAERVLRELESRGVIRRDGRYQRLGEVILDTAHARPDPAPQLFLAELGIMEMGSLLAGVRRGLEIADGSARLIALHLEGLRRAVVIQAFEATRDHLATAGVSLRPEEHQALEEGRLILDQLSELYTDWSSFCASRFLWNLSALEWIQGVDPLDLGYAGASLVAARKALTELVSSSRFDAAEALESGDGQLDAVLNVVGVLLVRFRRAMEVHFRMAPAMLSADSRRLLQGIALPGPSR